jgi:hypothetical protein
VWGDNAKIGGANQKFLIYRKTPRKSNKSRNREIDAKLHWGNCNETKKELKYCLVSLSLPYKSTARWHWNHFEDVDT